MYIHVHILCRHIHLLFAHMCTDNDLRAWPQEQPRSNNVLLFSRTLRLSKRFGGSTDFVAENVNGGHQTARSYFGVGGADAESGSAMASM